MPPTPPLTRSCSWWPALPTPKCEVGKGLTVARAETLLAPAEETRWYALHVTAATLGVPHRELLGLRWQDIDFGRAALTVAQTVARAAGQLYVGPATPMEQRHRVGDLGGGC